MHTERFAVSKVSTMVMAMAMAMVMVMAMLMVVHYIFAD